MPYTGEPATNPADEVRFMIGDTNLSRQLLSDSEVNYLLAKYPRAACAAYHGAMMVRNKFGGQTSKSIGSASISYTEVVQQMDSVLKDLKRQCGAAATMRIGAPTAGGIEEPLSISSIDFDNPGAINR